MEPIGPARAIAAPPMRSLPGLVFTAISLALALAYALAGLTG